MRDYFNSGDGPSRYGDGGTSPRRWNDIDIRALAQAMRGARGPKMDRGRPIIASPLDEARAAAAPAEREEVRAGSLADIVKVDPGRVRQATERAVPKTDSPASGATLRFSDGREVEVDDDAMKRIMGIKKAASNYRAKKKGAGDPKRKAGTAEAWKDWNAETAKATKEAKAGPMADGYRLPGASRSDMTHREAAPASLLGARIDYDRPGTGDRPAGISSMVRERQADRLTGGRDNVVARLMEAMDEKRAPGPDDLVEWNAYLDQRRKESDIERDLDEERRRARSAEMASLVGAARGFAR
jgi:hypothetical protein